MISLSIIIPAYNAEAFIKPCIESLIDKRFDNYEIIVIDDGSTDNTPIILDKLSKRYHILRVIHVNNGGVSRARNIGISKAIGEYITFVDSDDFVDSNYISEILKLIKRKNDLCLFNYIRWISEQKKEIGRLRISEGEYCNNKILFNEACGLEICCLAVWVSIFRKDIIIKNHLLFDENMKTCEDFMFSLSYYKYVSSFSVINKPLYYYRLNENSVTIKRSISHANDYAKVFTQIKTIQNKKTVDKKHILEFNIRWTRWIVDLIANFAMQGMNNKDIKNVVYTKNFYRETLKMNGKGLMFYIDHLLLIIRSAKLCYIYVTLLNRIKRLIGKYKL